MIKRGRKLALVITLLAVCLLSAPTPTQAAASLGGILGRIAGSFGLSQKGNIIGNVKVNGTGTKTLVAVSVNGENMTLDNNGYFSKQFTYTSGSNANAQVQFSYLGTPAQLVPYSVPISYGFFSPYPNKRQDHNFVINNTGVVQGTVTSSGSAVNNSNVTVDGATVHTDSSGAYRSVVNLGTADHKNNVIIVFSCDSTTYSPAPTVNKDSIVTANHPCSSVTPAKTGTITGRVMLKTSAVSITPVANASVTITGTGLSATKTSQNDGYYYVPTPPPATAITIPDIINVSCTYSSKTGTAALSPTHSGINSVPDCVIDTTSVTPPAPPIPPTPVMGTVSGYAYKSDGSAFSGVTVTYLGNYSPQVTDSRGHYQITNIPGLPRASLGLRFSQSTNSALEPTCSTGVTLTATNNVVQANCTFAILNPTPTSLEGIITIGSSLPARSANVTIRQNGTYKSVSTSDDGSYLFENLPAAPTTELQVESPNSNLYSSAISLIRDHKNTKDVQLVQTPPNILRGNITVPSKYAQAYLKMRISKLESTSSLPDTVTEFVPSYGTGTRRSYYYQSEKLLSGSYIVEVCHDSITPGNSSDVSCDSLAIRNVVYIKDRGENKQIDFDLSQVTMTGIIQQAIVKVTESTPFDDFRRPLAGASVEMVIAGERLAGISDQKGEIKFSRTYGLFRNFRDIVTSVNAQKVGYDMVSHNESSQYAISEIIMATNVGKTNNDETSYDFYIRTGCEKEQIGTVLFWFCGTEAKQAHKEHVSYWQGISAIIKGLQDRFGKADNPPEVIITGGQRWQLPEAKPIVPNRATQSGCFPAPKNLTVPFADSFIVLPMSVHRFYNWDINKIRVIVVHEWGHMLDFENNNCQGMGSINSVDMTDGFNRGKSFNDPRFFDIINEHYGSVRGGGHPQDNVAEFVASAFATYILYYDQFTAAAADVSAGWRDIYRMTFNFISKGDKQPRL